ncbi:MAG: spore maturation protein [Clostridia bacterium]|nr:spore maturation protein [Clostridia bacterium]
MDGAKQSLNVAVTLFCIYAVWIGLASVAEKCGINEKAAKLLKPVCSKLFKTENRAATGAIAMNLTCNLLGIGASTPYAVKAIGELEKDKNEYAQKLLFVINAAGLQILPTTVIALRASGGSVNAADIFLPCLICCVTTTVTSVFLYISASNLSDRFKRKI